MSNLFEEHPRVAIGLIILIAGGGFLVSELVDKQQERQREMIGEAEGLDRQGPAPSDRLAAIEKKRYREPKQALDDLEQVLASPQDDAEAAQAKELHPDLLRSVLQSHLQNSEWDEAQGLLERLTEEYPGLPTVEHAQRDWSRGRTKYCRKLLKDEKLDEAVGILGGLSANGWLFDDSRVVETAQEAVVEAWKAAGSNPDDPHLLQAAGMLPGVSLRSPLTQALRESDLPGEQIRRMGDLEQAGENRFRGIPFYQAALWRLGDGRRPWSADGAKIEYKDRERIRREIEENLVQVLLAFGNQLHEGNAPLITTVDAESVFRDSANNFQNQAVRAPLYRRLVEIQSEKLMTLSESVLTYDLAFFADRERLPSDLHNDLNGRIREAFNLADDIRRRCGARLWASLVSDPDFDPWPLLPETVRADFDKRREEGRSEESLRQSLGSLANRREFRIPLPLLEPVRRRHAEITARRGLLVYQVQPVECVRWLRQALADNGEAGLRDEIVKATATALLNSRGAEMFEAFYELTGFFVADIGLENLPDGLRSEFTAALEEAAAALDTQERPKAIFLRAVQAEAHAGDSSGVQAELAAIEAAYQEVGRMPVEEVPANTLLPSGLEGFSVLSVDNSTPHHLLAFYRGPESFFIACRPYRKVSAVLKDGEYEIAVIVPSGAIRPYHGKVALKSAWQQSAYTVGRSDQGREPFGGAFGSAAGGDYQLARAPKGAGELTIDPDTGSVAQGK